MEVKEGGIWKGNGISELELHRARHHCGHPYWCSAKGLRRQTALFDKGHADLVGEIFGYTLNWLKLNQKKGR